MSLLAWTMFGEDWELQHKVRFDGAQKLIIVPNDVTNLDIKTDIYSDWKEWVLIRDNGKFEPAIRSIGGDPTVSGQRAGDIYFLINGWKLVIDLTSTTVTGILFSDDYDTAYYDEYLNEVYAVKVSSTVNTVETTVPVVDESNVLAGQAAILAAISALETLTPEQNTRLQEIWQLMGLDDTNPLTISDTTQIVGSIVLAMQQNPSNTVVTRQ